jgi:hypothetical protein
MGRYAILTHEQKKKAAGGETRAAFTARLPNGSVEEEEAEAVYWFFRWNAGTSQSLSREGKLTERSLRGRAWLVGLVGCAATAVRASAA